MVPSRKREREIELQKNREINEIQKYKGMKSDAERKRIKTSERNRIFEYENREIKKCMLVHRRTHLQRY